MTTKALKLSTSQRNIADGTFSAYAAERGDRAPLNGRRSTLCHGRDDPIQRSPGVGRRRKPRYATASSVASDDSAQSRSTIAHRIRRPASFR